MSHRDLLDYVVQVGTEISKKTKLNFLNLGVFHSNICLIRNDSRRIFGFQNVFKVLCEIIRCRPSPDQIINNTNFWPDFQFFKGSNGHVADTNGVGTFKKFNFVFRENFTPRLGKLITLFACRNEKNPKIENSWIVLRQPRISRLHSAYFGPREDWFFRCEKNYIV